MVQDREFPSAALWPHNFLCAFTHTVPQPLCEPGQPKCTHTRVTSVHIHSTHSSHTKSKPRWRNRLELLPSYSPCEQQMASRLPFRVLVQGSPARQPRSPPAPNPAQILPLPTSPGFLGPPITAGAAREAQPARDSAVDFLPLSQSNASDSLSLVKSLPTVKVCLENPRAWTGNCGTAASWAEHRVGRGRASEPCRKGCLQQELSQAQ